MAQSRCSFLFSFIMERLSAGIGYSCGYNNWLALSRARSELTTTALGPASGLDQPLRAASVVAVSGQGTGVRT